MTVSGPVDAPELDAAAIAAVLNKHDVRYLVIGAFAALAQQAPIEPTRDIDLTPDAAMDNLRRLSAALKELDARMRTGSPATGLPFDHDGRSLGRVEVWNLVCSYGEFNLCFRPAGFEGGYPELMRNAHRVVVQGVAVTIADLGDVIRSKEAAGRPKDLLALPALYRFQASRRDAPGDQPGGG